MTPLSIVIICKNEAAVIGPTLQALQGVTDDLIVYDNGSTDATCSIVRQFPVRLEQGSWEGFGKTKNKAIALAKYDWILSLDADETLDDQLKTTLQNLDLQNPSVVYDIPFKNFLGAKHLKYGEWGRDHHIRLFNRQQVKWDESPVHEQLVLPAGGKVLKLKGAVLHKTMQDTDEFAAKMVQYAELKAGQYFSRGKKASWFKIHMAPGFNFFVYYILKGGFLDGHEGYVCAKMTAFYTFLKYSRLRELYRADAVHRGH